MTQSNSSFTDEKEGQLLFYKRFLPRVDSTLTLEQILTDYTDGVVNGSLIEFKLHIPDLNAVLLQSLKYLSALRIKGKSVPRNILLVSLDDETCYLFDSNDYLKHIEKIYIGGASKNNNGFVAGTPNEKIDYSQDLGQERIVSLLKQKKYTRIHIDENCIVGWARRFYEEKPMARKEDFIGDQTGQHKTIGEIRYPRVFKNFIYPYEGPTNEKFAYLMDKLNDTLQKKDLGAFYTHPLYAKKSLELVHKAIQRVPQGNDYVIIDRCAGTGNLELALTNEELSHAILSTLEYYEYKVLLEKLGDKVRHIIPPTERVDTFNMGLVRGADALSEEYINNAIIKSYVDNPKCTIILFENPPYAETTSIEHQKRGKGKASSGWKKSYVVEEMKKEVKGTATNDLGNAFIWSAFKYYLRQDTDSYIVFSPVKYWKAQHLIDKKFIAGYAFNRRHFHTDIDACIMCALWSNQGSRAKTLTLSGFDIDKNGKLGDCVKLDVKRIYENYSSKYFDKRTFPNDEENGIVCGLDGTERGVTKWLLPIYNNNIIGYMAVYSSGFDNPDLHSTLLGAGRYDGHGFYLRSDNYLEKLPMFAASRYITYNRAWTERARIMKSADGAERYSADVESGKLQQYLLRCLLFVSLEPQNHVREFIGSDGRHYRNQLTLDTTNGETLAAKDIKKLTLRPQEENLITLWNRVLSEAKTVEEYNPRWNYGLYQIRTELNITYKNDKNETKYRHVELNSAITALAKAVKEYYLEEIVPQLFTYEFLK